MAKRLIHSETHTTALGIAHTAKVYRDTEHDEWVVQFAKDKNTNFKASYYASDKHDAIETAGYHVKRMKAQFA